MASSSHPAKDSTSEDDLRAETLIAHDQDHGIYILGPICIERPLFSHITESFIIPNGFQLPLLKTGFLSPFILKSFAIGPSPMMITLTG